MRVGIGIPATLGVAEFAATAEAAGFDYVSSSEHVSFHEPVHNGLVALAAAAGATTRIGLVSTVTIVPVYPAALLAKLVSTLGVVSGGRFTLGLGVGGEYEHEFAACGVPVAERYTRADEAIRALRGLLGAGAVPPGPLERVRIEPRPPQGCPPIWMGGRGRTAMRRAARLGDGWMPYLFTPEQYAASVEGVRAEACEVGRDEREFRYAVVVWCNADDDPARARRLGRARIRGAFPGSDDRIDRHVVAGTPAECARRLQEFEDAGAEAVLLNLACPDEDAARLRATLAADVLPAVRGGLEVCTETTARA